MMNNNSRDLSRLFAFLDIYPIIWYSVYVKPTISRKGYAMKSRTRLIAIITGAAVLLAALIVVIVCAINANRNKTVTLTTEKATEVYDAALQTVLTTEAFNLEITTVKSTTAGENVYSLNSLQNVTYVSYGTDSMQAQSQETMTIGQKETAIAEVFVNNTAYVTVDGTAFTSQMTKEGFIGRFAPLKLVSLSSYKTVDAIKNREGIFIQLSDAITAEQWALPAGGKMISATGSIQLDKNEQLYCSVYNIEYSYEGATVNLTVTVKLLPAAETEIVVPTGGKLTKVSYIDTAKDLEILYGYLLQSGKIYAQANESINCQASGIQRDQKTVVNIQSTADLDATIDTTINIVDYNDGGDTASYIQYEVFKDNVYTISKDGGEATAQSNLTARQMLNYCQDLLVKNVILPENIATVILTEEGETRTLQITGTEELAGLLCSNVCRILYDDPELLNNLASSYKTNKMTCYFKLDKHTGLPLSAGLNYSGEHTIEGFAYTLTYTADISYVEPVESIVEPTDETTPTEKTSPQ